MSESSPAETDAPERKPFQFTLWTMFVVMTVFAIFLSIAAPLWRLSRREARREECGNNLKQITLALLYYQPVWGTFPPAYVVDENGKPMHSWRVLILPYLEEDALYKSYDFDEPWDGPNNRKLHQTAMPLFNCPSNHSRKPSTFTNYVAVVGPETAWPGEKCRGLRDFFDGASYSILLVEVADSDIHWMEPRDLELSTMNMTIGEEEEGISSKHGDGANVAFADGHVHWLRSDVKSETLEKILLIQDGSTWPDYGFD